MEEAPPGSNICHRGEDIEVGEELLSAKTCVKPEHIGILAGQGCVTLVCHRRPQVPHLRREVNWFQRIRLRVKDRFEIPIVLL